MFQKQQIYELYKKIDLSSNEANAEFDMILDFLKITDYNKILKSDFSPIEEKKIFDIVEKRTQTNEPLQYILGFAYFAGKKYIVDKSVLIPRPETEILIEEAKKIINKKSKILEIGVGSGCISIELQKFVDETIDGIDISENALKIAIQNAKLHNQACHFFQSDLFENVVEKYDVIVSNPPYIPPQMMETLEKNVKDFEPHLALFTTDKYGIEFYKKIIDESVTYFNNSGYLIFEMGINQCEMIKKLFVDKGFDVIKIIKDFDNIERVIIAKKS